jgi:hypothetical protein
MHPDTWIEELEFEEGCTDLAIDSGYVMRHLFAFSGLKQLSLWVHDRNLQKILKEIKLSTAETYQLRPRHLRPPRQWWHVVPGQNLSSLQTLFFENIGSSSPRDIDPLIPHAWNYLQTMRTRKVYFKLDKEILRDTVDIFFSHSPREKRSTLEWLIEGERLFPMQVQTLPRYNVDLRDLSLSAHDKTLQILHNIIPEPSRLRICIYNKDQSIINLLPKTTTHLDLFIMESMGPNFVPQPIRSVPGLIYLSVNVYGKKHRQDLGKHRNRTIDYSSSRSCVHSSIVLSS